MQNNPIIEVRSARPSGRVGRPCQLDLLAAASECVGSICNIPSPMLSWPWRRSVDQVAGELAGALAVALHSLLRPVRCNAHDRSTASDQKGHCKCSRAHKELLSYSTRLSEAMAHLFAYAAQRRHAVPALGWRVGTCKAQANEHG